MSDKSVANQMSSIRWFFNATKWRPTREEWLLAVQTIQSEELSRINSFVFKNDTKLALIGRLLMRSCVQNCFKTIDYKDIRFGRTDKGKPFIAKPLIAELNKPFDLNISHSGDYCVCAADQTSKVGVDVMKIQYSGGESGRPLNDFFRLMNRQFSQTEWVFINSGSDDWQKLCRFIRLWTLKESYVKAEGIGIAFDLKRISFQCLTPDLRPEALAVDTNVMVDGQVLQNWIFEESLLDNNHCVCVAYQPNDNKSLDLQELVFKEKTITNLLESAVPLDDNRNMNPNLWTDFEKKSFKKF